MAYTPQQQAIIRAIIAMTGRDLPVVRKALLSAGLVESNLRHVRYGDRDSLGFLQQRPSQGWGAYRPGMRGVRADIRDFLLRARALDQNYRGRPGQLAQAVQRSAFPGRYAQQLPEVMSILAAFGGGGGGTGVGLPQATMRMPSGRQQKAAASNLALQLLNFAPSRRRTGSLLPLLSAGAQYQTSRTPFAMMGAGGNAQGAQLMMQVIRLAQQAGLAVRENPFVDPVDPVHTKGSYHYQLFPGRYKGRQLGRGVDISGGNLQAFLNQILRRYGPRRFDEIFYDPWGGWDSGQKIAPIGGHQSHIHFSV